LHRGFKTALNRPISARRLSADGYDRCTQLLARISSLSDDVLELDAKEESSHRSVWKRRSDMLRAIHTVHAEFTAEIDQIIGAAPVEPPR
jgi:hypothetical protein